MSTENIIGLERHTVRVVKHDPGWTALFANECEILHRVLTDLIIDIQHVGSTAVSDLPAKPILDIAIAVRTLDLVPDIVERLTGIGYIYRGDEGNEGGHLFVRGPEPDISSFHVHVVEQSDSQWKNYLLFRDTLRDDAEVRRKYADFKRDLAKRFPDDRSSYTSAKDEFIQGVLSKKGVSICSHRPVLQPCALEGYSFQLDPYIGCEHHCYYCYALNEAETDWTREIQIHQNIRTQLSNEISSIDTQPIYIGWNSDPYQPLEAEYQQTRQALELLAERRFPNTCPGTACLKPTCFPVCVLTKSDLVARDIDLFKRMPGSSVGISIAFQNDHDRELFEANTPSNRARLAALEKLHEEGIETYTLICPVMPFITDVEELISLAAPYSDTIWIYALSLNRYEDRNWQNIRQILQEHYPEMVKKYKEIAFNSDHAYWTRLRSELRLLKQQTQSELRIEL